MNQTKLKVIIAGRTASDCNVTLFTGEKLGLIQSVEIAAKVGGGFNTAKIESILDNAEVEVLAKNTQIKVLLPRAYQIRYWIYSVLHKVFGI